MTRESLVSTVKTVLEGLLYAPYCGFECRANELIRIMPAALIEPVSLLAVHGVDEGERTYCLKINLMKISRRDSSDAKEALWSGMQSDAERLCRTLVDQNWVRSVKNLSCKPAEFTLTNKGGLSMCVEMEIVTLFSNLQATQPCA